MDDADSYSKIKEPEREACHSPPTSGEIDIEQKVTSTLPCAFIVTYFYDKVK